MEPGTIAKPPRSTPLEESEVLENAEQEYINSLWRFATYLADHTVIQDEHEAILDDALEELGNYLQYPRSKRLPEHAKIVGGKEYPERIEQRYEHSILDPFSLQGLQDALFQVGMAAKVEKKGRLDDFKDRTLNVKNARLQYEATVDSILSRQHGMTGEEYKRAIELGMEQKRYLPYALSATDKISKKLHSPREEEIRDVQKEQERFLAFYEAEQKKLQELKDDPEKLQDFIDELDRKYFLQQGAAATAAEYPKKMAAYEEFMKEQTPMEEGVPDKFLELLTSLKDEAEDRIKKAEAEEAAEERKADFRRSAAHHKKMADKLGGRRSTRATKVPERFTYDKLGGHGIVRGRGLYFPAGENHYIDMNKLDKGFINLKNNKFKQIGKMEVAGGTLCSAVKSVLKGQNPRAEDVDELNDRERGYLNKLAKVTGEGNFHVPVKNLSEEEKEQHEFDVMKGEIIAGNDNEKLVKDFKRLLLKLMSKHKINKKEGHDILMELVILGY